MPWGEYVLLSPSACVCAVISRWATISLPTSPFLVLTTLSTENSNECLRRLDSKSLNANIMFMCYLEK